MHQPHIMEIWLNSILKKFIISFQLETIISQIEHRNQISKLSIRFDFLKWKHHLNLMIFQILYSTINVFIILRNYKCTFLATILSFILSNKKFLQKTFLFPSRQVFRQFLIFSEPQIHFHHYESVKVAPESFHCVMIVSRFESLLMTSMEIQFLAFQYE